MSLVIKQKNKLCEWVENGQNMSSVMKQKYKHYDWAKK